MRHVIQRIDRQLNKAKISLKTFARLMIYL